MVFQADVAIFATCLALAVALLSWSAWRMCRQLGELDHELADLPMLHRREGRMKPRWGLMLWLATAFGALLTFDAIANAHSIIGNG